MVDRKGEGNGPHASLAVYVATRAPDLLGSSRAPASLETCSASTGGVAFQYEQVDLRERLLYPGRIEHFAIGSQDLLGRSGLRTLVRVKQILMEFLARTRPDDLDRDVALGLETGQPDHRLGEVDDLDRLAHLEHEHLARLPSLSEPARMISCTASGIVMK